MHDVATLPTRPGPDQYDVLVVGAGPAGLATGIALRRSGVRVLVVDKHAGTSVFPKATVLRTRGLEILRSWGLERRLRRVEQPLRPQISFSARLTEPPTEVRSFLPSQQSVAATSPTTIATVAQDQLEALLLKHLVELGGEVRFRTEMIDFDDAAGTVSAAIFDRATQRISRVQTRFLVAADGARSPIRTRLGIEMVSYGSRGDYGTALVRFSHPGRHSLQHVITSPLGASLLFPTAPGRWAYHVPASSAGGRPPAGWTPAEWTRRVQAATGVPAAQVRIDRTFVWDFGAAAASALSSGRVFLVGDAAHRATPNGGTGTSVAIADAHNLAWKLAYVVRGWAEEPLLDSYGAERGPVAHRVAERSMAMTVISPIQRLADDLGAVYRSGAIPRFESWDEPSGDPTLAVLDGRPGARAPHIWVTRQGRTLSTTDMFEGRLTVLTGPDAAWARAGAARLRADLLPVRTVTVGRDIGDPSGGLLPRFGLDATGAVLVRPDGHVAWRAESGTADSPAQLVSASRTMLSLLPARDLLASA